MNKLRLIKRRIKIKKDFREENYDIYKHYYVLFREYHLKLEFNSITKIIDIIDILFLREHTCS